MLTGILLVYICCKLALPTWCFVIGWADIVISFLRLCVQLYKAGKES